MSLFVYKDGVLTATSAIRLRATGYPGPQVASAADGSGSQGAIVFDDPPGTMDVHGWQIVKVDEADCASAPTIFYGAVGDHIERRGPYLLAGGREIDTTLNDSNIFLACRLITGGDAIRPAETDTARLAWLLGSAYLSGMVYDLGLVNGAGRDFDAVNYHGMYAVDVLNDLIGPRGQIFFTYWDQSAKKVGLFYDSPTATTFTSTLSLTNVQSEVDSTHLAVNLDWEQSWDASDVFDHIRYVYAYGVNYAYNPTTTAAFFNTVIGSRGINVENDGVGRATTAATFSARILARDGAENPTMTGSLKIPAAQVGLIRAGMRIAVHLTHLTGFQTVAYSRVKSLTIAQTEGDDTSYDMGLVLSTYGPPGTGNWMGPPVPQGPPPASIIQTTCGYSAGAGVDAIFDNPVSIGNMIVVAIVERDGTIGTSADTAPGGPHNLVTFTEIDEGALGGIATQQGMLLYRIVTSDDFISGPGTNYRFEAFAGTGRPRILAWELTGVDAPDAHQKIAAGTGAFTFPSLAFSGKGLAIGYIGMGSDSPEPLTFTPHTNIYVEAGDHFWQTIAAIDYTVTGAGSQVFSGSFSVSGGDSRHEGVVAFFPRSTSTADPPKHGQWSEWTVITMTGATGSVGFANATGSIEIKVDGVLISPASYTEADDGTGNFTLSWTPDTDEVVTARAQGL